MDNTNTICPLCNKDFSDSTNDNIIKCPDCGINYHKNCWELNGGCSTADCTQNPSNMQQHKKDSETACPKCGSKIKPNTSFCTSCGVPLNNKKAEPPQKRYCPICHNEIFNNQQFCTKCGYKINNQPYPVVPQTKKKSKKKIIIPIVIALSVILLAVVGIIVYNTFLVSNVELSDHTLNIEIDSSYQLSCTVTPETALNKSVKWTSTDTNVATVDDEGNVTAVNKGTVTITATTSSGKVDECVITVTHKSLSTVYDLIGGKDNDYYCTLSYDGSYMEIDTNPFDIDDYSSITATKLVQDTNNALGLPTSVWTKMSNTNALDGRVSETYGDITVSWKYHPDNGLEVIYECNYEYNK